MQKLTHTEEEVMMHIWSLEKCIVSQILERYGADRPPHSTISSVVRILEKKGFVDHKAYGRTHEYFPIIEKKAYFQKYLEKVVGDYFQGSAANLVSFLVKERQLKEEDLKEIIKTLQSE